MLTELSPTGVALAAKTCVVCPARSRVFTTATGTRPADPYTCQTCPDARMTMTATGDCVCDTGSEIFGVAALGPQLCLDTTLVRGRIARTATNSHTHTVTHTRLTNSLTLPPLPFQFPLFVCLVSPIHSRAFNHSFLYALYPSLTMLRPACVSSLGLSLLLTTLVLVQFQHWRL